MKKHPLYIAFILGAFALNLTCKGQIIFPKGHEKKLITPIENIYDETAIPFIYPMGKITDLKWKKLSDSFPVEWTVVACMNGTCIPGTPEGGQFLNILNNPDSIGFVKFHFDFNGKAGRGVIKYIIFEDFYSSNFDIVTLDVTYDPTLSEKSLSKTIDYSIFPNPIKDNKIWINIRDAEFAADGSVTIFNSIGQTVGQYILNPGSNQTEIELPLISKGIYFIKIQNANIQYTSTIIKE